jgi:hypothetical protein
MGENDKNQPYRGIFWIGIIRIPIVEFHLHKGFLHRDLLLVHLRDHLIVFRDFNPREWNRMIQRMFQDWNTNSESSWWLNKEKKK